jgi:hypothetical protein
MPHISIMPSDTAATPPQKKSGQSSRVVGRSAVTGKYVLRPASKRGSITVEQVRKVVKSVSGNTKQK